MFLVRFAGFEYIIILGIFLKISEIYSKSLHLGGFLAYFGGFLVVSFLLNWAGGLICRMSLVS